MSKKGEKARSSIHLSASKTAGAIRLTITALKRGTDPNSRMSTIEDESRHIVQNAPNLDFAVNVRNSIGETAQSVLNDLPSVLEAEDRLERLNAHLAKMELVQDLTTE